MVSKFPLSMLILGQKSYFLGPTIIEIPQSNWHYCCFLISFLKNVNGNWCFCQCSMYGMQNTIQHIYFNCFEKVTLLVICLLCFATLWCFCSYADIRNSYLGNSTYVKVILTKNLTFIIIIYHTKLQFANISRTTYEKNVIFWISMIFMY